MSGHPSPPPAGSCSHCGECCRWLPVADVGECTTGLRNYYRERGLKESGGMFLADAPCRHLVRAESQETGTAQWVCAIYEERPAVCRLYCGKSLAHGMEYYVPEACTMAGDLHGRGGSRASGRSAAGGSCRRADTPGSRQKSGS